MLHEEWLCNHVDTRSPDAAQVHHDILKDMVIARHIAIDMLNQQELECMDDIKKAGIISLIIMLICVPRANQHSYYIERLMCLFSVSELFQGVFLFPWRFA